MSLIESTREMQRLLEMQRLRASPSSPTYCNVSLSPVTNSPQRHKFSKVLDTWHVVQFSLVSVIACSAV
jgi:hypothetical protein